MITIAKMAEMTATIVPYVLIQKGILHARRILTKHFGQAREQPLLESPNRSAKDC